MALQPTFEQPGDQCWTEGKKEPADGGGAGAPKLVIDGELEGARGNEGGAALTRRCRVGEGGGKSDWLLL